ncbi:hypothetical protein PG996_011392 [Apiospora saccharicola]|uniref:Ankyrin repeat protein n=1 Tax=Apiospora saccharicola TaxID=335842 RepID=A0ABR1UH91_9PEZI
MSAEPGNRDSSPPARVRPGTCLSTEEPHDISDHLLHYLGCLTYNEREKLFDENNEIWEEEISHFKELDATFQDSDPRPKFSPEQRVRKKREAWKADCEKELTRVRILREAIRTDKHDRHLDESIRASSKRWMDHKGHRGRPPTNEILDTPKYNLERDISVPIIQYKLRGEVNGAASSEDDRGWEKEANPEQRVWGDFPDQKTKLDVLKTDPTVNLLHQDRYPDRIKYFHLPSNNMIWAENALSRYFGEERPDRHAIRRELKRNPKTRAYMLLRDPFWRSQLHGGQKAPPHARHMEPMCITASSVNATGASPENMVLFMPFLHWETSRQREKSARTITQTVERSKREDKEYLNRMKEKRIEKHRIACDVADPAPVRPQISASPKRSDIRIDSFPDTVPQRYFKDALRFEENYRLRIEKPLGHYLLDAARLFEGMSNYRDKKLLEKYTSGDTPLHPRRTLDQAYHWKLNTTKKRDRDQVVYRATTIPSEKYHIYHRTEGMWPKHKDFNIEGDCDECTSRIKKVSRVVMVDQLWMWVLDKKTIITCFPKRYGVNKQDSSGVHKSIRRRLEANPQIRTVFDLGLIIFDECSNVFFDRTSVDPSQPAVIDIFSKAIGNVMHQQTASFDRLWKWTELATKAYRSKNLVSSHFEIPLLDINPEGKLQREIKDIIEELDIMLHITTCHRRILKQYKDNAENMLDPYGDCGRAHSKMDTSLSLHNRSLRRHRELTENLKRQREKTEQAQKQSNEEALKKSQMEEKKLLEKKEKCDERQDYTWFMLKAEELSELVEGRITELCELRASAVSTADSVKDLLELKQQQAGVVQAWQAVNQASETIKQGRSIMMFTLVTIVFLPLSFMSSIFGMNNQEFSGGGWDIRDELRLMFPVSAAVILVSLFWAYSNWSRVALWAIYKRMTTWLVVKTRVFDLWLRFSKPEKNMIEDANRVTEELLNKARNERYRRNREDREAKERKTEEKEAKEAAEALHHTHGPGGTPVTILGQERREYQNGKSIDVEMALPSHRD